MRVVRNIDIDLIDYDRLPSLKSVKSLISHLKESKSVPPIKVVKKNGRFILKNGRHRLLAHKILNYKQIKAKYYENVQNCN